MSEPDIKLLVCVDVGTVGTAAVFCPISDRRTSRPVNFPKPPGITYDKIPSKIILKASTEPNEREVIAFGYEAEDLFADRVTPNENDSESESDDERTHSEEQPPPELQPIMFFSNFKKHIIDAMTNPIAYGFSNGIVNFDEISVPSDNKWKPEDSGEHVRVPLKEIISKFMRCIADVALAQMEKGMVSKFNESNILWIFSTPEIWDEYSKGMMLDCAHDAGLTHCEIASEAGCAAAWFLHERRAELVQHGTEEDIPLKRRTRYLLIDIGGGTTDCVYHQIDETQTENDTDENDNKVMDPSNQLVRFRVSEKFPSIAAPVGALMVEEDFVQFVLRPMFGDRLEDLCQERPDVYIGLMRNFFVAKIMANPSEAKRNMKLPSNTDTMKYLNGSVDDVNQRLSSHMEDGKPICIAKLNKRRGLISITQDGWRILHARLFAALAIFIRDQLNFCENRDVVRPRRRGLKDYVVFCGGFSKSLFFAEFVKDFIATEFPDFDDVHFLKMAGSSKAVGNFFERPEQAVASGGLYSRNVCKLMSPAYYGFQFNSDVNWLSNPDPDHVQGDLEVDLFQLIVSKYQSYTPGDRVEFTSFHPSPNVDSVTINVYKCDRDVSRGVPRYVDEDGCKLAMSFDVPVNRNAKSTKVQAVLQPGSIELRVILDGEESPCQLRFL